VRENLVFDSLIYLKPVERFKNDSKTLQLLVKCNISRAWTLI